MQRVDRAVGREVAPLALDAGPAQAMRAHAVDVERHSRTNAPLPVVMRTTSPSRAVENRRSLTRTADHVPSPSLHEWPSNDSMDFCPAAPSTPLTRSTATLRG